MIAEYQLHTPEFFIDPFRAFREFRAEAPVYWYEPAEFWGVFGYRDVRFLSSNPDKFSNESGVTVPEPGVKPPVQPGNILFSDPPRHRQLRKLVSSGFTPRHVAALEAMVEQVVAEVLDRVEPATAHEFAEEIAAPLPTRVIAELLGAPPEDWEQFRVWSDAAVGGADPEVELDPTVAMGQLNQYFEGLVADRRQEPRDDILSVLVGAEIDGERLSDEDLLSFAWTLMIAGNETTRNLIALGTLALIAHPEERQKLVDDPGLIPGGIEEMLRWCSPVTHMARRATVDVELGGRQIRAGDFLVMFYGSANRDETIFGEDAEEFKVTRTPNTHVAFGFGEHLCLGASLARLEARVMFEGLLKRFPKIELDGEVKRMRATMVPGVKRMPVRMTTSV